MKTTKTNENLAHIAIDKSRVKEYNKWDTPREYDCGLVSYPRTVYLENGQEFQIELFNPYKYEIGVSFSFDESRESSELLILKPGERYWLDRYLDSPKKFLYSTYEVENSEEAKEAISDNGNVKIKFYKVKEKPAYRKPVYRENYDWDWNRRNPWDSGTTVWYSSSSSAPQVNAVNYCQTSFDNCATLSCSCSSDDYYSISTSASTLSCNDLDGSTIETGRIEEGSHSDQEFKNVYKDFENWPFKTENIKILPRSQRPVSTGDLEKRYCHECGRKIKTKFKFCPFCGEKQ